jgi:hypothetical protein
MAEKTHFSSGIQMAPKEKALHPKRCELCRNFEPPIGASESGLCLAQYPIAIPMPGPAGQIGAASLFPPMKPTQRCGKWEPVAN